MTGNTEIPRNPETNNDFDKLQMYEKMEAWRAWAKYMIQAKENELKEKDIVAKLKDQTIAELRQRESNWVIVNRSLNEQLGHYKDMVYYLFHRPYKPKPKSNKRSTKNKGNE